MRIAIPTTAGRLGEHFAACRHFTVTELDDSHQLCQASTLLEAPAGGVGETVDWLAGQGVTVVVAGAMDVTTERALCAAGIRLVLEAPSYPIPAEVIAGPHAFPGNSIGRANAGALLAMLHRRPCTLADAVPGCGAGRLEILKLLESLCHRGEVAQFAYEGQTYYRAGTSGGSPSTSVDDKEPIRKGTSTN